MVSGGMQVVRRHEREDERAEMVVLRLRRELQRVFQVLPASTMPRRGDQLGGSANAM